ncbi:MAG: NAD(P)-binding protein [Woeseia sp.]|nr:NAD(P)-binding protein [Woeseia sp.]
MNRTIDRRQFCQGSAVGLLASLIPIAADSAFQGSPEIGRNYYPPAALGLRGAHPGAFEVAHGVAREGRTWPAARSTGEAVFDLVVVGGGLSGLAAAWFFRQEKPHAKILILENHDDFGGHAKRNEFTMNGKTIIGYGGSQSIDSPSSYSAAAAGLLKALAIDTKRFYNAFDDKLYDRYALGSGYYLDAENFGTSALVPGNYLIDWAASEHPDGIRGFAKALTRTAVEQDSLFRLLQSNADYLPELTPVEKVAYLRSISYEQYLSDHAQISERVLGIINSVPKGLWGVGADAISAREAMYMGMAGFGGLGIDPQRDDPFAPDDHDEPYIFHFPDGNASIARLLVRQLIPNAASGNTMADIVDAPVDYRHLDTPDQDVKLRLNATAVHAAHRGKVGSASGVDLTYVKAGEAWQVSARHVIYAGYSAMLPHLFPEFPATQAEQFRGLVKAPLVYANVALRNWRSFAEAGMRMIRFPGGLMDSVTLDFPVSLGDYRFAQTPDDPMLLHFSYVPTEPGKGLDNRAQMRIGRSKMLGLSFADYERAMRSQLADALSATSFDPARDIAAITVNRWPHGYAYEYNDLYDPPGFNRYAGPHVAARRSFGRVSIAGSDAEAYAYVDGAIDAAWRAVREQLSRD